jgi:hypothetical protein
MLLHFFPRELLHIRDAERIRIASFAHDEGTLRVGLVFVKNGMREGRLEDAVVGSLVGDVAAATARPPFLVMLANCCFSVIRIFVTWREEEP